MFSVPVSSSEALCVTEAYSAVLFNDSVFSLLVSHLTVKECFAVFPRLSKWHRSFLNGEHSNSSFLCEWTKSNHGLPVLTSPHCYQLTGIIQPLDRLMNLIFVALDESHYRYTGLSLSIVLRHLYDSNLTLPDKSETPELPLIVHHIRNFQRHTYDMLEQECVMKLRPGEFDIDDPSYLLMMDIVRSPPLFDPCQSGQNTLKDHASRALCQLVKCYPDESFEIGVSTALKIGFYISKSLVTRDMCVQGLFQFVIELWNEPEIVQSILDSDLFDRLAQDIETHGCHAFPESMKAFRKICQHKELVISDSNVTQMIRVCAAAMKNCKSGRLFQTVLDCFYFLARDLISDSMETFIESGIFEVLSQLVAKWNRGKRMFNVRLILLMALVCKHGTPENFNRIKKLFTVMEIVENGLRSSFNNGERLPWKLIYALDIIFTYDEQILSDYFQKQELVAKLIKIGISSLKTKPNRDFRLAKIIVHCIQSLVNSGMTECISILVCEPTVWRMFGDFVLSGESALVSRTMRCVCSLLSVIRNCDIELGLKYSEAKEECDCRGVTRGIKYYCRSCPVKGSRLVSVTDHFPIVMGNVSSL